MVESINDYNTRLNFLFYVKFLIFRKCKKNLSNYEGYFCSVKNKLMKIYHNPRCSKSRVTLQLLKDKGIEPRVIEYLTVPISEHELSELISLLGITSEQLIRKGETVYKEKFKGKTLTDQKWIDAMIEYPKLMERPIVVNGNKAVIGRPPENIEKLF